MSLWLTDGFSGGAGGDWGQRVGREYFMGAVTSDNIHIVLHESASRLELCNFALNAFSLFVVGHTFALDGTVRSRFRVTYRCLSTMQTSTTGLRPA